MANDDQHDDRELRGDSAEYDERAVRSIPLDTDDGGQVVIEQQNMGGVDQVGGGEFKDASGPKTPDQAAREQAELEREAPIGRSGDPES